MPKSVTQRSREYRERLKLNPSTHAKQKQKERERWKKRAAARKIAASTVDEKRKEKERERKAKWRAKKKCNNAVSEKPSISYNSSSALGKAYAKVNKNLPKESPKKLSVLAKIVENLTPKRQVELISQCSSRSRRNIFQERKQRSDVIPEKTILNVIAFFEREDISRMLPGIKDSILIRTGGLKERKQKRILEMSLNEAYSLYCTLYGAQSIGITKFRMLRPKHVLVLASEKHQEVCYCIYHENIDLILHGFQRKLFVLPIPGINELCNLTLCQEENRTELCYDRQCTECGVKNIDTYFNHFDVDDNVTYHQWVNTEGITKKLPVTTSVAEGIETLKIQLTPFARHVFNIKTQQSELQYLKDNLPDKEVIVIEDFAENYSIRQQREVMSAHWHADQVTIFTAIIYYNYDDMLCHQSYAVISDDLQHDKGFVFNANRAIFDDFQKKFSFPVEFVHYWSDGAGSQFKNRYNLGNLVHHKEDFGFESDWSFFETAHGKGPADGIGAAVKRGVWTKVLQNKVVINTAKEFFELSKSSNEIIKILFVSHEKNEEQRKALNKRWGKMTKPIIGTQKLHYVKPHSLFQLKTAQNSPFTLNNNVSEKFYNIHNVYDTNIRSSQPDSMEQKPAVGNFVTVEVYSANSKVPNRLYVAQICSVDEENAEVLFLRKYEKTNKTFSFPEKEDRSWVLLLQIKSLLPEPLFDERRYNYTFDQPIDNIYA